MMRICDNCQLNYDDAARWTICPHNPLEAGPRPGDFCRRHDMFGPCPCCAAVKESEEHPMPGKPRRFNPFSLLLPIVGFVLAYLLIPDRLAPWCGVLILLGVLAYAFREGR